MWAERQLPRTNDARVPLNNVPRQPDLGRGFKESEKGCSRYGHRRLWCGAAPPPPNPMPNAFFLLAVLLTVAALSSYLNHRFIGLPTTVALMGISLALALGTVGLSKLGWPLQSMVEHLLAEVDLSKALLGGALSFLLFAGALHIEFEELHEQRWRVLTLAFLSTTLSLFLVAGMAWYVFHWLGLQIPLLYCLIFGSLISPTDPVAVLGLLKKAGAPLSLETKITGESLFNDGVGIVGFSVFLDSLLATGPQMDVVWSDALLLLVREAGGGIALGWTLGWVTVQLIKGIDHYPVEVLLTLALVSGGYALGMELHVSGPLIVATAGLIVGHYGRKTAMSETSRQNLDSFWELMDEVLNALLFVLVGLQVTALRWEYDYLVAALVMTVLVLVARAVSVGVPTGVLRVFGGAVERHGIVLLTWGGLRGAISVALALSLPPGREHDLILTVTYGIVAFSILVQGTTLPWLLRRLLGPTPPSGAENRAQEAA